MTLNEVYKYDFTAGNMSGIFFNAMSNNQTFPAQIRNVESLSILDFLYFSRSGNKEISPFVRNLIDAGQTKTQISSTINKVINVKYTNEWKRLFDLWNLSYNPIENYNMREQMTNDTTATTYGKTHTRTDNLTHGISETDTITPNTTETETDNLTHGKTGTETQTPNVTNETDNTIHGFNSSVGVPTDEQIQTTTGTDTKTFNTSETDTGTKTVTKTGLETRGVTGTNTDTGTVTDTDTGQDINTRNYTLTRAGNIGVTSSQQLAESEINLWSVWDIFERVIFPDLDKLLVLPIY